MLHPVRPNADRTRGTHLPCGRRGRSIEAVAREATRLSVNTGEPYVLGDSPVVTLTTLRSAVEADPASSDNTVLPAPAVQDDGTSRPDPNGRAIRLYTTIETRLTFGDMLTKLSGR